MRKMEIVLFVKGDGPRERIAAEAEETLESGAAVYRFFADGARFTLRFGAHAAIEREGDIAYRVELDPNRTTYTEIVTEYGFLSAEVKTLRSEIHRKNGLKFKGEYEMKVEGVAQRHEVSFYAEEKRRTEN